MKLKDADGRRPDNHTDFPADLCFYCRAPHPEHKEDCQLRRRSVVLRMTIDFVVAVPRTWDKDQIEFQRNEGSLCATNDIELLISALRAQQPNVDKDDLPCFCSCLRTELVREADEHDHLRLPHESLDLDTSEGS